jgi:hypothetical protein
MALADPEVTMSLAREIETLTRSYLGERASLEEIRQWLVVHAQDVVETDDPRLDQLDGELWLLISELDRGDRDEASVRVDLEQFFREDAELVPASIQSEGLTTDPSTRQS